jgi:AraC family transcriptional regulator
MSSPPAVIDSGGVRPTARQYVCSQTRNHSEYWVEPMNELTHQFRGEILRSVQANGLALVDQHTQGGGILPRHRHSHAWFTFLFAGSYIERLPSLERCCSAGMVIWHPPDLMHENRFVSNGHNMNLVFAPEWLEGLPPDISLPDKARQWEGGLPYRLGLELYRSLNRGAQISEESVVNLISLCASGAHRHGQTRWMARVLEWMNDEYSCALTLTQASEQAGVHPVHVSRSFRRMLGCTFREYLTLIRLRRATDLLKGSLTDITEIAHACGFSDHAHFTRTFKRATGITPTAYRIQAG